jgi:hypothetical protein
MSDDHKGPTSHRRRRPGIDSVSGKCVACASSMIVAGIAGIGLSWHPGSGLPGTAAPTRFGEIKLIDASDSLASLENLVIILPGADDSVVLPSDNVINLPFGGDGLNNFFGAGEPGAAGSAADTATGQTWDSFTTSVEQITIPGLNDTIVLPGSNDTFSYLSDPFSGNDINLPFSGETDFFGSVFGDTDTAASGSSSVETATANADSLPTTATDSIPSNAIVLPGSADTIVFPSFNTINLPFGGDGENNFGGGGNGGDGGVGTGIGTDGTAGETAATAATAASTTDGTVTVSADTSGNATFLPGAGEAILFPSNNTFNFPFGGDDENDFLGGGDGGDGGDGTGIGTGGIGGDTTGIGIGIGGDGGDGGDGAQFFPVQINFVDSANASAVTVADSSASSSDSSSESLDDFLAGILGSNGTSDVSTATGTAIGIGADGGDGGNGAVPGATEYTVNTADLTTTQSASLDGFLDSLSSGDSTAVAGQAGTTVTDGTSVSIDGSGGAGGSAAEFFPITLDWDDSTGDHSVTVTPVVLLDDMVSYFGGSATDSTSSAGDLGDLLGSNLSTLMSDLSSLF